MSKSFLRNSLIPELTGSLLNYTKSHLLFSFCSRTQEKFQQINRGWRFLERQEQYAEYKPDLALKYVENVLSRYEKDGLAFQRYGRVSQFIRH